MNSSHEPRLPIARLAPAINRAMVALDDVVASAGLEKPLLELVRLRASQLNGCAFCMDMHARDAMDGGEAEHRLFVLPGWREAPWFTARERAALALTEAVTLVSQGPVSDEVYDAAAEAFEPEELAQLIWAFTVINTWNRIGVTAQLTPTGPSPVTA